MDVYDFSIKNPYNLFLKYFSNSNNNASYLDNMRWNSTDRADYMAAMHKVVDPIFDSIKEEEEDNNE